MEWKAQIEAARGDYEFKLEALKKELESAKAPDPDVPNPNPNPNLDPN